MEELYKNIRKRREELGMSQDALAKKVGYTDRSSIAKIEAGKVDVPHSKVEVFAKALNISIYDLLGSDAINYELIDILSKGTTDIPQAPYYFEPEVAEMAQELHDRPEMKLLFDASKKLSKEDLEAVTSIIEKLSRK